VAAASRCPRCTARPTGAPRAKASAAWASPRRADEQARRKSEHDVERASLLWQEYSYRHDLIWRLLLQPAVTPHQARRRFAAARVARLATADAAGRQTLTDRERVLGPNHPDTLTPRNNLAYAYASAGDMGRATPLYEQTLTDTERILGPNHPATLASRNNLAYAYRSAGDLGRAIPIYEQTLADAEQALGPDHPSTLTFRDNLAGAIEATKD
jgi:tetratricopeptide (TPR) repeat protein